MYQTLTEDCVFQTHETSSYGSIILFKFFALIIYTYICVRAHMRECICLSVYVRASVFEVVYVSTRVFLFVCLYVFSFFFIMAL